MSHLFMVIDPCAKYGKPMSKQKNSYGPDTKTCQKTYKFDLEVNVQGRFWIIYLRDTSSYGDTPMCQICQTQKKLWAGHENMSKTL